MKKILLSLVALATMALSAQAYTIEPAENTVLPKSYSNYASMSFTFNFDQAVTVGDLSGVKLMKGHPSEGTEVAPDDDWRSTSSNGGKTITLWGADYDGYTCTFACEDELYFLVVPAGTLTDEEIVVQYYGMNAPAPAELALVSTDPEANTVLPQNDYSMVNMTFTLTFDRALTNVDASNVALREEDATSGAEVYPMDEWRANLSSDKTSVTLWGADYDGYTDYFTARDVNYYLVVPAGAIVAGDLTNTEDIVIEYYGKKLPATAISDINTNGATEVARYNIAGQRVDASHSGVVIVKMSDGSTMKMIVR